MKNDFIKAIHTKNKILLHFFSKEDGIVLARTCAPMDFGPSRRTVEKNDRFHLWDYDSDTKRHTLSLNLGQIQSMEILNEEFNPAEFVTWDTKKSPWFIERDWGVYS